MKCASMSYGLVSPFASRGLAHCALTDYQSSVFPVKLTSPRSLIADPILPYANSAILQVTLRYPFA